MATNQDLRFDETYRVLLTEEPEATACKSTRAGAEEAACPVFSELREVAMSAVLCGGECGLEIRLSVTVPTMNNSVALSAF